MQESNGLRASGDVPGTPTERAIRKLQDAKRLRRSGGVTGAALADHLEAEAALLLKPSETTVVSCGEAVPACGADSTDEAWTLRDTLQHPSIIACEASETRVQRASEAQVLALALDAAQSIGAQNSLERMLAHELAAAHDASMRLITRAATEKNPVEAARLTNAAARMMDTVQRGLLVLERVRRGGTQRVIVQRVQVGQGQVVVAGQIGTSRRPEDGHKE